MEVLRFHPQSPPSRRPKIHFRSRNLPVQTRRLFLAWDQVRNGLAASVRIATSSRDVHFNCDQIQPTTTHTTYRCGAGFTSRAVVMRTTRGEFAGRRLHIFEEQVNVFNSSSDKNCLFHLMISSRQEGNQPFPVQRGRQRKLSTLPDVGTLFQIRVNGNADDADQYGSARIRSAKIPCARVIRVPILSRHSKSVLTSATLRMFQHAFIRERATEPDDNGAGKINHGGHGDQYSSSPRVPRALRG